MPTLPADNGPSLLTDTRSFKEVAPDAASIPSLPAGPKLVTDDAGNAVVKNGPRAMVPIPAGAEYINARQYCDRLGGISYTTLARYIKSDKDFPRPVRFGRDLRFFKVSEILAYEKKRCEARSG